MSVAIIGAGELGGALAHMLAIRDRVRQIRLIDPSGSVAAGKALDIRQCGPLAPFATRLEASTDPTDATRSDVIVIADSAGQGNGGATLEADLALLKRLAALGRDAVFVCARAGDRELVERGVREARIPRERIVGGAPLALASAVRALVAIEIDGSPNDVHLTLVGNPPDRIAVAWNEATIAGSPIETALTPPQLARLKARLRHLWPPGPLALARAATRICEALVSEGRQVLPCFVTLEGELGARGRATAAPVLLGPEGVIRIVWPSLSANERVILDNALRN